MLAGELYLVVVMVPTHSDGVHDELPSAVVSRGTVGDVVWVVLRTEVVA